ncbi:acyl-CoA dehydrogenase/oxidase [Hypoxylon sp. NC1633]|nr:acyl-CoA dehydrogenase/oxidase [Hypoxylon sp. NC1633]
MAPGPTPSSSTEGFFQVLPSLNPQYTSPAQVKTAQQLSDDPVLARILQQYLSPQAQSSVGTAIHQLSRRVLEPTILQHCVEAETQVPFLRPLTTFGEVNKTDPLVTCAGWKALKAIGVEEGVVSTGYDERKTDFNRRVAQFSLGHVWSHSAALTMCPMAMTDGAAKLLSRHLGDSDGDQPGRQAVFAETYRRLVSNDPGKSWTSGQWMTERSGGSDVSEIETVARKVTDDEKRGGIDQDAVGQPLGPWRIDGFKWFSSATDSDVTILLARTSNGISVFLVPLRRMVADRSGGVATELNGIRIQRLKNKMGTKGLPTAELELRGARGWLIGQEGKGVKEISSILNITRIHTAAASVSYWSRGLAVCRAFSKVRRAGGRFLYDYPQHVKWMAVETVKYWAATQFCFFGIALLGVSEQGWDAVARQTASSRLIPRDAAIQNALLRLLTPVIKSQASVASVAGLRESMECLGGVGYCENNEDGGIMNLARLFRDSVVDTIWEGTANVMAGDVVRVIKDKRIASGTIIDAVFAGWVREVLSHCRGSFSKECDVVKERLRALIDVVKRSSPAELEYRGRDIVAHLEGITSATVLLYDATRDGDEVASRIASRYVWSQAIPDSKHKQVHPDWQEESPFDLKIFLGGSFQAKHLWGKL